MKILFVTHRFPPLEVGGTELLAVKVAARLIKRGNDIAVFAPSLTKEQEGTYLFEGIEVHRLLVPVGMREQFSHTYADSTVDSQFANFVSELKPDIAIVWHTINLSVGILDILSQMDVPYILFLADFYYPCHRIHLLTADKQPCDGPGDGTKCRDCILATVRKDVLEREGGDAAKLGRARVSFMKELLQKPTMMMAPSEYVRERYVEFGVTPEKILVIPPGVDVKGITGNLSPTSSQNLRFGYLGGNHEVKGISSLLDAFTSIKDSNVELLIAGERTDQLSVTSFSGKVRLLGIFEPEDIGKVLSGIDVLIVPSICHESFSFVIREAFAAGIPVIVSDLRAQSDAIRAGLDGLKFASGNGSDLASRMLSLINNPETLESLRRRVPSVPDIDETAAELERLLSNLVQARKLQEENLQLRSELLARITSLQEENLRLRSELVARITSLQEESSRQHSELAELRSKLVVSDERVTRLQGENLQQRAELTSIKSSFGYKLMRFYASRIESLCPDGTSRGELRKIVTASLREATDKGQRILFSEALGKIQRREFRVIRPSQWYAANEALYDCWIVENTPKSSETMNSIKALPSKPKISIVMPVYDTDAEHLNAAIESVRGQLYEKWQLCVCDSGSTLPEIRRLLREFSKRDKRISITTLSTNKGIAAATNAALAHVDGEFTGFLDHDDILYPDALFQVAKVINEDPEADYIYSDEDKIEPSGRRTEPFFKPDWSPDLLLSVNYVTHFSVYRTRLLESVGGLREGFEGSQDYDLVLRATEKAGRIRHIPKILYGWRKSPSSTAQSETAKPIAYSSAVKALQEALERREIEGLVEMLPIHRYRVRYAIKGRPLITIIIPTRSIRHVAKCVKSILDKTRYDEYEILVIDNGTGVDLSSLLPASEKVEIIMESSDFNWSKMNNRAAKAGRGEYVVFLNDDTEVIDGEWLTSMLEHAQREEVGAVGAKLLYPEGTVQHAGIIVGINGFAGNYGGFPATDPGYFALGALIRNCSAVTGACMMVRKSFLTELGGFDETLGHSWNDVDFGIRVLHSGRRIIYTPFALLYHHEGGTRGQRDVSHEEIRTRELFRTKNLEFINRGDPYYNPNLSLTVPYEIKFDKRLFSSPHRLLLC